MSADAEVRADARQGRRRPSPIIPVLLLLVGIAIMLYPVGATLFNNYKQQEFANRYNQDVLASSPEDLSGEMAEARQYNSQLTGVPILDPYLLKVATDPGSTQYQRYMSQLDKLDVMARVRVPSAAIDLPVRHGTWDESISNGAGHLYGTSLPVGGLNTHAVLTSHTGMPNATLFDHLSDVKDGDLIFVDVLGETLAYKVDQIKVVLPEEIGDLAVVDGHDYLTLFTCTPYGVNSHRLLVRGERVPFTPEAPGAAPQKGIHLALDPWMWGMLAGAAAGLLLIVWILVREGRARRRRIATANDGGGAPGETSPRRAAG